VRGAFIVLGIAACHGGADTATRVNDALERSIQSGLTAQLGVAVRHVTCSGSHCTATLETGDALPVVAVGKDWELAGMVISSAPLEQYVDDVASDLGLAVKADCGPRIRAAHAGDRIDCGLGADGRAFATVKEGGDFTIELAIGPDAVAARLAPYDEGALERASSALALDRAGADDEEGGDAPVDGGAPP
jgi:hypothetical protein